MLNVQLKFLLLSAIALAYTRYSNRFQDMNLYIPISTLDFQQDVNRDHSTVTKSYFRNEWIFITEIGASACFKHVGIQYVIFV